MVVNATATGLDIDIDGKGRFSPVVSSGTMRLLEQGGIARLSFGGQTALEIRKPLVVFGTVSVAPPPGVFLQATAAAEETMAGLVTAHLARSRRTADLFSGCGAFSFRLAPAASVHAVESDAGSVAALLGAARGASGLKPVSAERRDLFRRPLSTRELKQFDGLVFDPPRAGAEAQAMMIAKSDVQRVAAVSCNPGTLGRDLRLLIDCGYRLERVVPIDQFLWSHHVETVALLARG
jgi:23S rRNA (uracil1939-C5)-methyltransferase